MSLALDKELLTKIGGYILEGLSEDEACILSDVQKADLTSLKEKNESVREYIEKCKVNFKYLHLKELQTKKSDKTSQWLLERLRPEDFNISQRSKHPTTINVIGTIIQQIQQDDTAKLIPTTREARYVEGGGANEADNTTLPVRELLN